MGCAVRRGTIARHSSALVVRAHGHRRDLSGALCAHLDDRDAAIRSIRFAAYARRRLRGPWTWCLYASDRTAIDVVAVGDHVHRTRGVAASDDAQRRRNAGRLRRLLLAACLLVLAASSVIQRHIWPLGDLCRASSLPDGR